LLHKPLSVIALRSLLHQLLRSEPADGSTDDVCRFTSPS
jgi:hypothetical protein